MKPVIIDKKTIRYKPGVEVTVKEILMKDGTTQPRYFLYSVPEMPAGSWGWKSLESMINRYEWYKSQGWIKEKQQKIEAPDNPFFL
jgi:hypothetical protein